MDTPLSDQVKAQEERLWMLEQTLASAWPLINDWIEAYEKDLGHEADYYLPSNPVAKISMLKQARKYLSVVNEEN